MFLARARRLARRGPAADRRRPRDRRRRGAAEAPRARRAASACAVDEPRRAAPAAAVPEAQFAIAWEDEHLIVVDKPAGVVVHPARGHAQGTLAQALAGRVAGGDDPERAGIVHRLDRDTSGLLVVARSEPVHAALRRCSPRASSCASTSRSSRAGPPRGAARSTRRWAATGACARASRPTPTSRARRSRTSRSSARCRTTRCCACGWRPAARTRSARTCWRSGTRSPATPSTARPGATGCGASSCMPRGSRSRIP